MEAGESRRAEVSPGAAASEQMDERVFASRGNLSHRGYLEMAASAFKQLV